MAPATATTSTCAKVFIVDTTKVDFDKTCSRPAAETWTSGYKLWDRIRYETKLQGPKKSEEELCGISETWTENFSHTALYIRVPPLILRNAHKFNIAFAPESQISGPSFLYWLFARPPNQWRHCPRLLAHSSKVQSSLVQTIRIESSEADGSSSVASLWFGFYRPKCQQLRRPTVTGTSRDNTLDGQDVCQVLMRYCTHRVRGTHNEWNESIRPHVFSSNITWSMFFFLIFVLDICIYLIFMHFFQFFVLLFRK